MASFLYTWNPKRWKWVDQDEAIYRINNNDTYDMYWSCGNTKKIVVGDIFFLMKLGVEPKGIIGCGYVVSEPFLLPHWDDEKRLQGKQTLRTDLKFMALSEIPIFSLERLVDRYSSYKWTPQAGGLAIPEEIAQELINEIQMGNTFSFQPESPPQLKLYAEGKSKVVSFKSYDRSSRARQDCIEHFGYDCVVCGFNFKKAFGEIGSTYIEIHHLQQVADVGEEYLINPIADLRPVCANCHRMLHKKRPPISIEELIRIKSFGS